MPGQLLTPETNRKLFDALSETAQNRTQPDEVPLFSSADYDPNGLHDFNNNHHFDPLDGTPSTVMLGMFGALLDRGTGNGQDWVQSMVGSMGGQLAKTDVAKRLEAGQGLVVLTAHKTRFEPTAVELLIEAALAAGDEDKFDELRARANVIVSAHLSTIDLNMATLTGNPNAHPINMINVARRLGGVTMTFPDTNTMRNSGISEGLRSAYKARMLRHLLRPAGDSSNPRGPMTVMAANATMESVGKDRVYPITRVAAGTSRLIEKLAKNRSFESAVIAVASDHAPVDNARPPFSLLSRVIAPEDVTAETAHHAMSWIAQRLTGQDVPASYDMPDNVSGSNQFAA